jgi:hypothetical protein
MPRTSGDAGASGPVEKGTVSAMPLGAVWSSWRAVRLSAVVAATIVVSLCAVAAARAKTYGTPVPVGSGFSSPSGVAVDASGNIWVTDSGHNAVVEIPAGGGAQQAISGDWNDPTGITADSVGDVFVANTGDGDIVKISASPGIAPATIATGFNHPQGVGVNASGDLAVADTDGNQVYELLPIPFSGAYAKRDIGYINDPTAAAIDSSTTEYAVDYADRLVEDFPDGIDAPGEPTQYAVGSPSGITIDSAGDIFYATNGDPADGTIVENGTTPLVDGLDDPVGIAIDANADFYAAEPSQNQVMEVPYVDSTSTNVICGPPAPAGTPQTCTVTVTDTDSPASTPNGSVQFVATGFNALSNGGECTLSGGSCSVTYTPPSYLGGSTPLQVSYGGDAAHGYSDGQTTVTVAPDQTSTKVSCGPVGPAGTAQTCTATVSDTTTSSNAPTGTVAFSSGGQGSFGDGDSCTLSGGSCSVSYTPSQAGTGSQTITGQYPGMPGYAASSGSTSLMISGVKPVVSLLCASGQPKGGGRICTATVNPPSGSHGARPTGSVSFTVTPSGQGEESLAPASCTLPSSGPKQCATTFSGAPAGTYRIVATYESDQTYLAKSAHYTVTVR